MPIIVALIRGLNVGGHNKLKMADLRALCESLDLRNAQTVLQSGNLVFEAASSDLAQLGERLGTGIAERFGFSLEIVLRTRAQFKAALRDHPFDERQLQEPGKAALIFLSAAPDAGALANLRAANPGREVICADGSQLYVFYTDGMARSKLDNKRIERALRRACTARNWNTCQRLLKLLADCD